MTRKRGVALTSYIQSPPFEKTHTQPDKNLRRDETSRRCAGDVPSVETQPKKGA
ncbi:MAG: hypothetical protein JNN12_11125 [Bacteroidetes Order II. Incertae sedis bacterium]|nr:hypothetical protein [Bacteroidetes Order II. bacterium]